MNKINHIKINILSDIISLKKNYDKDLNLEINSLLNLLDKLSEAFNLTISKLDNNVLIANKKNDMIILTLKESNTTWKDLLEYRLTSLIFRH